MPNRARNFRSTRRAFTTIKIDPEKIGALIGPGGKTIRGLQEEFAVKIDVEEDGTVFIAGVNGEGTASVMERIRAMTESPKLGSIYTGKVVRLTEFGAFVEIAPGIDGLVHVSQLADYQVKDPRDVVKEGDDVMVMITDIDAQGKIRLSRRAVLEGWTVEQAREADPKLGSGGGDRGGGSRGPRRDGMTAAAMAARRQQWWSSAVAVGGIAVRLADRGRGRDLIPPSLSLRLQPSRPVRNMQGMVMQSCYS